MLLTAELQKRQRRADLHVDRHPHGAVNPRDFFRNEYHGEKAETVAAVFFRNDTAEESQFAHFEQQVFAKVMLLVILGGGGRDLFFRKLARQVADRDQFFG